MQTWNVSLWNDGFWISSQQFLAVCSNRSSPFFFFFALHKGYPFTNSWVKTNLIWFFFLKKKAYGSSRCHTFILLSVYILSQLTIAADTLTNLWVHHFGIKTIICLQIWQKIFGNAEDPSYRHNLLLLWSFSVKWSNYTPQSSFFPQLLIKGE